MAGARMSTRYGRRALTRRQLERCELQMRSEPICWCLRFSDLLEPTRDWSKVRWLGKGVVRLQEAAYAGRLAESAFLQTGWLIQRFGEAGGSRQTEK